MTAQHLLDRLWIQTLQNVANGGVRWRTLSVQTECGAQPAAMHLDEGLDRTEGVAAGDHGEDREQQDVRQLVELALGPAGVGDLAEHSEERIEWTHGNLLAIGLPGIDSGILPRRNPAFVGVGRIRSSVAEKTQPSQGEV